MLCALKAVEEGGKALIASTQSRGASEFTSRIAKAAGLTSQALNGVTVVDVREAEAELSVLRLAAHGGFSCVVYDSVTQLYLQFIAENPELVIPRNKLLLRLLAELHSVRRDTGCTLVYTSTTGSFIGGKPLAYAALSYFSDTVVELGRTPTGFSAKVTDTFTRAEQRYSYSMDSLGFGRTQG
ncbi:MAG: hypothetical protein M1357_02275 [Candidatus Marsarchaeota archaeon]|nr:hypothetical protein [Candidatus Marsarchaeota archaeon]